MKIDLYYVLMALDLEYGLTINNSGRLKTEKFMRSWYGNFFKQNLHGFLLLIEITQKPAKGKRIQVLNFGRAKIKEDEPKNDLLTSC